MEIGSTAPDLRLPSAQGPDICLGDFRGRRNVIVWFHKGLMCPFCRRQMVQLAAAAPQIGGLQTEVLQVTSTFPEQPESTVAGSRCRFCISAIPTTQWRRRGVWRSGHTRRSGSYADFRTRPARLRSITCILYPEKFRTCYLMTIRGSLSSTALALSGTPSQALPTPHDPGGFRRTKPY
jgi:AhpC/TSA family